jgi:hypothetical protein
VQYASIEVLELMPLLTNTTPGVNTYGAGVNQVLYSHCYTRSVLILQV